MSVIIESAQTTDLLPSPWTHLGSARTQAVLRVQNAVLAATRDYLTGSEFMELLPPVIGPVTDPGTRGSKQVDVDYYGTPYRLMTSAILYKQVTLLATKRMYCIAPNVRLEPLNTFSTSRHLTEFHQIDVEVADIDADGAMDVAEDIVRACAERVIATCGDDLRLLGRDPAAFHRLRTEAFARVTHAEATERLRAGGHPQDPGAELDWTGEARISESFGLPTFVTGYPKGSRAFYDQEDPADPGRLCNFDLLAGEGYGELASGGQREYRYREVITRMRETGENPLKYQWYLDVVRQGMLPSAGFGIGVERLVRYFAGLEHVWQASAFPKLPGVVSP